MVSIVKDEMNLLNVVDKPNSDVDQYVQELDRVLLGKMNIIGKLRDQLLNFHKHLKTEEKMSALYQQMQQGIIESTTEGTKQEMPFDCQDDFLLDGEEELLQDNIVDDFWLFCLLFVFCIIIIIKKKC